MLWIYSHWQGLIIKKCFQHCQLVQNETMKLSWWWFTMLRSLQNHTRGRRITPTTLNPLVMTSSIRQHNEFGAKKTIFWYLNHKLVYFIYGRYISTKYVYIIMCVSKISTLYIPGFICSRRQSSIRLICWCSCARAGWWLLWPTTIRHTSWWWCPVQEWNQHPEFLQWYCDKIHTHGGEERVLWGIQCYGSLRSVSLITYQMHISQTLAAALSSTFQIVLTWFFSHSKVASFKSPGLHSNVNVS